MHALTVAAKSTREDIEKLSMAKKQRFAACTVHTLTKKRKSQRKNHANSHADTKRTCPALVAFGLIKSVSKSKVSKIVSVLILREQPQNNQKNFFLFD